MIQVKVNQRWVMKDDDGNILKRLRILAPSPIYANYYIYKTEGGRMVRSNYYGTIPMKNLDRIFELEQDVCTHRHTDDWYDTERAYPPSVPTHYICTDCGDKFPNTGDTDFWFPKVLDIPKVESNESSN